MISVIDVEMKMEPASPPAHGAAGSSRDRSDQLSRCSSVGSGHTPSSSAPNTGEAALSRSLSQSDIGNHSFISICLFIYR